MRPKPPIKFSPYLLAAAHFITLCVAWTLFAPRSLQAQEPVTLPLGANFQAIVDANPPGTAYIIASGIHRAQSLIPKDGDVITGAPGAILNGCLLLQDWQKEGDWWVHLAPVVLQDYDAGGAACNTPICLQSQDLYVDGQRIDAVTFPDFVTKPNLWYFDKARGVVMVKFDPTQTEVEFGGPSVTAINCLPLGLPEVLGVVIKDLTIEKYPSPPQTGSVQFGGGGSEMRNCTVRFSHGYGIRLLGPVKLIECHIHNNGLAGVGGSGAGSLIYRCEINDNIWSYYFGLAWDSGGIKLANTNNVTFRNNYFHHNKGPGIWTDIKTQDVLIEENIVELNDWEGILPELSNHITLRKNVCRWNGVNPRKALWGGQICVQNSSHILLDSNYIETGPGNVSRWGNPQGFMAFNQDHRQSDEQRFSGDFGLRSLTVTGNLFLMPNGGANGLEYGKLGWPTYADFLNSRIVWSNNRYLVGRPLFLQWAWWSETNWPNNSAVGLGWDEWTKIQDQNSTLEIFGPERFPPTSTNQHALIKEVTGLDYPVLKAQLSYSPADSPADTDGDGLPEAWESRYFGSASVALPTDDGDQDGLSNLQEFTNRTNPLEADTDEDSVPDSWEVANKLNPLSYDSSVDMLLDGRSAREVYEDSLLSQEFTSFAAPSMQSAISMWLATSSGVTVDQNSALLSWKDQGPNKLKISWPSPSESWPTVPTLGPDSPSGAGLVNVTGSFLNISGQTGQWGRDETGFTATFVFQPTELDISRQWRALMTNEIYLSSGFRLNLESGYLIWSSYQNAGSLSAQGRTRLLPGQTYIITLLYGGAGRTSSIYVNGKPEAFGIPGKIVPSSAPMRLCGTGGVFPQPSRFGDVAVFNRLLSHQERRSLEGFLTQKFFTTLPEGSDRDGDGLPDTWENTYGLDTLTPNALSDEDRDGATNLQEFAGGLDPVVADSDRDGLPDGWEVLWGTNPLLADSNLDPDLDGLSHLDEFQNGSDPFTSDINPPFLAFGKRRLWWRADAGLETGPSGLVRWTNSAAGAIHAIPQDTNAPAITAPEPWNEYTVIRLSTNAIVSSTPVNPISVLHQAGITVTAAVRPPLAITPSGFKRLMSFNGTLVGFDSGKMVLRNESGSLIATSLNAIPSTPFIMTWIVPAAPEPASLQINGVTILQLDGLPAPTSAPFILGGGDVWPADVAEIIVHASALPPLHRRFAERVLLGKWLGSGPLIGDVDGDTLPDWWEHEACSDASLADASGDSDWNGIPNQSAYLEKRPGFVWRDADDDGMHDAWESLQGLDPLVNDAEADPDADDISNAMEHALLTSPRSVESNDPWSIANALSSPESSIRLQLRTSQRSWARRARWESSSSLEPGTWSWVPPGNIISRGAGATALEETGLYPSEESGNNRSLIRLKLLDE